MSSRTLRALLVLLAVGTVAGAAYAIARFEQQIATIRQAGAEFDQRTREVQTSITDVRAAQRAYVAAGQGPAMWVPRVGALVDALNAGLARLKQLARSPEARAMLDEESKKAAAFTKADGRAREYLRAGDQLMASDLIFAEAHDATVTLAEHLEAARRREADSREQAIEGWRRRQWIALAAAGGVTLAALFLLAPLPRSRQLAPSEETTAAARILGTLQREPEATASPSDRGMGTPLDDLTAVADLCTDLARVTDPGELPQLLGRIASVLHASGLIVWMSDSAGTELRPALAHGYPPNVVRRMGPIPRGADNPTALAFRAGQLRTVAATSGSHAGVAVPLLAPSGCIGVLAAELRLDPAEPGFQPLATVLAAQLAMVIGAPPPAAQPARAQA